MAANPRSPKTPFAEAVARAIGEGVAKHQADTEAGGHEHAVGRHTAIAEAWETEARDVLAEALGSLANHPDLPPDTRRIIDQMLEPEHFAVVALLIPALIAIAYQVLGGLMAGPVAQLQALSLRNARGVPIPVGMAIDAAARRRVDDGWAQARGADAGFFDDQVEAMIKAAQSPPSTGELLDMARRKIISEIRAGEGLLANGLIQDWVGPMLALKTVPPSAELAVTAEVQNHLDSGRVEAIMEANGLDPANHDWIYETAGQPPGIEELIKLWRRGKVSREQVAQAIRESRVKDKYVDPILETYRYVPPPRTIMAVYKQGGYSQAQAAELLRFNGLEDQDVTAYFNGAHIGGNTKVHEEAQATIVNGFLYGLYDRPTAKAHLVATKHGDAEADLILDVALLKRDDREAQQAIGRVRTAYNAWHITEQQASAALDALHVPHQTRDHLLDLWHTERDVNRRHLTETQIAGLWVRGFLTDDEAKAKLTALGLTPADAELLLLLQTPKPKGGRPAPAQ